MNEDKQTDMEAAAEKLGAASAPMEDIPGRMEHQPNRNKNKGVRNLPSILFVIALVLLGVAMFSKGDGMSVVDEEPIEQTDVVAEIAVASTIDYTRLPLGDDKYSTSPKQGFVYSCQTSYNGGGASGQGPWININDSTWDLTQKIAVSGEVEWPQAIWESVTSGEVRTITSTGLPVGHNTGEFPIASSDEAYQYDRNPNSIAEQTISFEVPLVPELLVNPNCTSGEVGIATSGVLIFNAFDAGGRDAVATEVQDDCEGHPQAGGYYHYHGYSSCFKDSDNEDEHSDLLGYAFDGFGIYGLRGELGAEMSSAGLDVCHGHIHRIAWDGVDANMFHYHMTQDFPYTVGCFRGEPGVASLSSGEGGNTGGQPLPPPGNQPPQ